MSTIQIWNHGSTPTFKSWFKPSGMKLYMAEISILWKQHWVLYRTIVRSKLDYGRIVYGTASSANLRQLDSIHNAGLRLALGAFCTSPVSSMYTKANETPLEERRLKLSMHYYLKTRACTDNPAHYALHEFDPTTRDLYLSKPNGKGGMTRPPTPPVGLKVEEALTSAEIDAEMVCPLKMQSFPPGTHEYDPERHSLIEGVTKFMITREEARAKFHEYNNALGPHDEVYTDRSKINERVGAAAVINRHFQNGEMTCRQLSKRLPNNSTIFATEAMAIILALDYYRYMDPVKHDVVVYSDSMSCLQAIEGEDTENPFICHIMNLLWALSDKGTVVPLCWVPSHCGIEGNEIVDQLAKETLYHDIDPLATVHYVDLNPVVNSYIQQEVQIKWDVSIHGRDLYLLKSTLGPPKKIQAPHKNWRGCNNRTSNWPYQSHKVTHLVPRTANCLSALCQLICLWGCVSSLNKCNTIQSNWGHQRNSST